MSEVTEVQELATPKVVINGFAIWDIRDLDCKSGWYICCKNDSHRGTTRYARLLADAKTQATEMVCQECVTDKAEQLRLSKVRKLEMQIKNFTDYLSKGAFHWETVGVYSGGRHEGATDIRLGFGVKGDSRWSFNGVTVEGEVYVTLDSDGNAVLNYAIKGWDLEGEQMFAEFGSDRAAFDEAMFAKLEPLVMLKTDAVKEALDISLTALKELQGN
jgi:hypothetical protein